MLTKEQLAVRLKEARERAGLTQAEVADRLGVPRPAIALIESGRRKVSGLELVRLAYLYGRSPADFLEEEFAADGVSVVLRALPDAADQDETREAIRKGIALAREIANLEHLLDLKRATAALPRYPAGPMSTRWDAVNQGKRLAHSERQRLEVGSAPLEDLGGLMENQGIAILELELPDDLSGFTVRLDESIACGVNITHTAERQRFSLAHEYCHVLADHDLPGMVSMVSHQEEGTELREVRANAFAAAFLMPGEGVRDYLSRLNKGLPSRPREAVIPSDGAVRFAEGRFGPEITQIGLWHVCLLANYFRVSRVAMIWQLSNLRFITERERTRLLAADQDGSAQALSRMLGMEAEAQRSRATEADEAQPARRPGMRLAGRRLLHLALEAFQREIISGGKLRELARLGGFDADDLARILEGVRTPVKSPDGQAEE